MIHDYNKLPKVSAHALSKLLSELPDFKAYPEETYTVPYMNAKWPDSPSTLHELLFIKDHQNQRWLLVIG